MKTSHVLSGLLWKKLLQSLTSTEVFTTFKINIRKCDKSLLRSVRGITNRDKPYYKVWQVLQSKTRSYYKVWHVLQIET